MRKNLFLAAVLLVISGGSVAFCTASEAHCYGVCTNTYERPNGDFVQRPDRTKKDATAICRDGTYSKSRHPYAGGTCSFHGGVERVL